MNVDHSRHYHPLFRIPMETRTTTTTIFTRVPTNVQEKNKSERRDTKGGAAPHGIHHHHHHRLCVYIPVVHGNSFTFPPLPLLACNYGLAVEDLVVLVFHNPVWLVHPPENFPPVEVLGPNWQRSMSPCVDWVYWERINPLQ